MYRLIKYPGKAGSGLVKGWRPCRVLRTGGRDTGTLLRHTVTGRYY